MEGIYYKSTRGDDNPVSPAQAIITGIARDGGLFVPNLMPSLDIKLKDLVNADLSLIHISRGMEPATLKKEFGKDIVFWGGGIDTQHVLRIGTQQQVRDQEMCIRDSYWS